MIEYLTPIGCDPLTQEIVQQVTYGIPFWLCAGCMAVMLGVGVMLGVFLTIDR